MKFHNILAQIGNTPIIKLNSLKIKGDVEIWAKIEKVNPGGSIKDRIALYMIEDAEKSGQLTPGKIVIEASSGNTGIGLALICAVKGYKCIIAMSESASIERRKIIQAFGAEILLTPASKGTDGAIEKVYELVRNYPEKYYCPDQFNNPANWKAHYHTTAPEIWRDTEGKVNYVVCGLGTTGTAMGIARFMKDYNYPVKVIGVEPVVGHHIQGLKNMKESYLPGIYDKTLLHKIYYVNDEEAIFWTRWLAKKEGLFVGISSGAALAGAVKLAEEVKKGLIVVIFPDGGEKYLSTPLWNLSMPKENIAISLFDTLTRKKKQITFDKKEIKIYTCGPTLNTIPHIGFYRRLITADIIKKFLKLLGFEVKHVVNFTDFDDKTIETAFEKKMPLKELTSQVEKAFYKDLEYLEIENADFYPKVSENLQEMVNDAISLLQKGYAYEKFSSLYFDVSRFSNYGKLSRIKYENLTQKKLTDLEEYGKEEVGDFALLKRIKIFELKEGYFVESPIGKVRPTWHIHCATLLKKYLGNEIDIYVSSQDLIFPHNENTRAILMSLSKKEPVKIWVHTNLVYYNGKKLSSENRILVKDVLERGFSGKVLRLYFLKTHYSRPINFSWEGLKQAQKLCEKFEKYIGILVSAQEEGEENKELEEALKNFKKEWQDAMKENLNTPLAISALIKFLKKIYILLIKPSQKIHKELKEEIILELKNFNKVFCFLTFLKPVQDKEILEKAKERDRFKKAKAFEKADAIREELKDLGYIVLDTPWGTKVLKRDD